MGRKIGHNLATKSLVYHDDFFSKIVSKLGYCDDRVSWKFKNITSKITIISWSFLSSKFTLLYPYKVSWFLGSFGGGRWFQGLWEKQKRFYEIKYTSRVWGLWFPPFFFCFGGCHSPLWLRRPELVLRMKLEEPHL